MSRNNSSTWDRKAKANTRANWTSTGQVTMALSFYKRKKEPGPPKGKRARKAYLKARQARREFMLSHYGTTKKSDRQI